MFDVCSHLVHWKEIQKPLHFDSGLKCGFCPFISLYGPIYHHKYGYYGSILKMVSSCITFNGPINLVSFSDMTFCSNISVAGCISLSFLWHPFM